MGYRMGIGIYIYILYMEIPGTKGGRFLIEYHGKKGLKTQDWVGTEISQYDLVFRERPW